MQVRAGLAAIVAPAAGRLVAAVGRAQRRADAVTLHRMRVSARRLRAVLSVFRGVLPGREHKRLRSGLRWLIRETGPARDWDVLVDETLPGTARASQAVLDAAAVRRAKARRRAIAALAGGKCARLVTAVERLVGGCRGAGHWHRLDEPLRDLAAATLRKRHKKLRRSIAAIDTPDRDELHRLRIRLRMQRYAVEAVADLYPGKAAARYASELKSLQRALGAIHDLQIALALVSALTTPSPQAMKRLERQCEERLAGQVSNLKESGLDAAVLKPFWA